MSSKVILRQIRNRKNPPFPRFIDSFYDLLNKVSRGLEITIEKN